MPTTTTATCEPDLDGDWRITLTHRHEPGWLGRLLGQRAKQTQKTYVGEGTHWFAYPSMRQPSQFTQNQLCDLWFEERARRRRRTKGDAHV